jgi:hypothetical protein
MPPKFRLVLGKGDLAGNAAIALNVALAVPAELAGRVVTAFARHLISPLALSGETSHNSFESGAWVTPRFGLPRNLFKQEAGRLLSDYGLGWWLNRDFYGLTGSEANCDSDFQGCFILPESLCAWTAPGLSYLTPNSFEPLQQLFGSGTPLGDDIDGGLATNPFIFAILCLTYQLLILQTPECGENYRQLIGVLCQRESRVVQLVAYPGWSKFPRLSQYMFDNFCQADRFTAHGEFGRVNPLLRFIVKKINQRTNDGFYLGDARLGLLSLLNQRTELFQPFINCFCFTRRSHA